MLLRRCLCGRDRALEKDHCTCGSTETKAFRAVVVIPGTGGKRRSKVCKTMAGAVEAQEVFRAKFGISTGRTKAKTKPVQEAPQATPQPPAVVPVKAPTFHEIWSAYHSYSKPRKRSWKANVARYTAHIAKPLGNKRVNTIKAADIQNIVDGVVLRKRLKPATAMQVFALIRVVFNHADRFELTPDDMPNPCRRVQPPKFDNRVNNPLEGADLRKLEETCRQWPNQHAARVVLFCMFTGRRVGEVLKLKWTDVDLENAIVSFRAETTKPGKGQVIPVNESALEVLRAASSGRRSRSPWVFPCSTGRYFTGFQTNWQRLRRRANLSKHYRFHDLRSGFASTLVSSGVGIYHVKDLLGHANVTTTQRYAYLSAESLRTAADVMAITKDGGTPNR